MYNAKVLHAPRTDALSLSVCLSVALIFCFRANACNLSRLSLSRSFFLWGILRAHTHSFLRFSLQGKRRARSRFFFFRRPACFRPTPTRRSSLLWPEVTKKGPDDDTLYERRRRHFFSFSFFFLSSFPRARFKNEHQHCSGTSDRADAGEFRPKKFFFLFFFFEWWWWFWGVPDAVARRVAVNRCGL